MGIGRSGPAPLTDAQIKTQYEANTDTNEYDDAEQTKLDGVEAAAAADQTDAEIKTQYENNADTNAYVDADQTTVSNQSGTNTGDEAAASESVAGVAELATQAETDAGSDDTRMVTPAKLDSSSQLAGKATTALDNLASVAVNTALAFGGGVTGLVETLDNGVADGNPTTNMSMKSGNKTSGTGRSGDVVLETGTSSGSTRGDICLDARNLDVDITFASFATQTQFGVVGSPMGPIAATTIALTSPGSGISFNDGIQFGVLRNNLITPGGTSTSAGFRWDRKDENNFGLWSETQTTTDDSVTVFVGSGNTADGAAGDVIIRSGVSSNKPTGSDGDIIVKGRAIHEQLVVLEAQTVSLTADDQVVTPTQSFINISSDNATATNRTFTITAATTVGTKIILQWSNTNAGELLQAGIHKLSATWTPTQYDTLELISDGTNWLEISRSANS